VRTVAACRYVTPLREGGSLPAIVEADDGELYVAKFRGAGQGSLALVAEVLGGELARALGLRVPALGLLELDGALARTEPDPEIADLLRASVGTNLVMAYMPGALTFDPAARPAVAAELASLLVAFDAFVMNVDRTARNPNLLWWHRRLYLIDHGASLYFHHAWADEESRRWSPFPAVRDHVLLPWADDVTGATARLGPRLGRDVLERVLGDVPDDWLADEPRFGSRAAQRAAYVEHLRQRLEASAVFTQEAERARLALV